MSADLTRLEMLLQGRWEDTQEQRDLVDAYAREVIRRGEPQRLFALVCAPEVWKPRTPFETKVAMARNYNARDRVDEFAGTGMRPTEEVLAAHKETLALRERIVARAWARWGGEVSWRSEYSDIGEHPINPSKPSIVSCQPSRSNGSLYLRYYDSDGADGRAYGRDSYLLSTVRPWTREVGFSYALDVAERVVPAWEAACDEYERLAPFRLLARSVIQQARVLWHPDMRCINPKMRPEHQKMLWDRVQPLLGAQGAASYIVGDDDPRTVLARAVVYLRSAWINALLRLRDIPDGIPHGAKPVLELLSIVGGDRGRNPTASAMLYPSRRVTPLSMNDRLDLWMPKPLQRVLSAGRVVVGATRDTSRSVTGQIAAELAWQRDRAVAYLLGEIEPQPALSDMEPLTYLDLGGAEFTWLWASMQQIRPSVTFIPLHELPALPQNPLTGDPATDSREAYL